MSNYQLPSAPKGFQFPGASARPSSPSRRKRPSPFDNVLAPFSGVMGLGANLADDVIDTAWGLPAGVVKMVTDPIESLGAMKDSYWETYSPLFSGQFGKFARGVYDHPLGPILDVAAVVSLGAGAAATAGGQLARTTSATSRVGRAARGAAELHKPKTMIAADPEGLGRPDMVVRNYSTRAGRRLAQEGVERLKPHLPVLYQNKLAKRQYNKAFKRDVIGRQAAFSLTLREWSKVGRMLSHPGQAKNLWRNVFADMWHQTTTHAHKYTPDEAVALLNKNGKIKKSKGQMLFVRAEEHLDGAQSQANRRAAAAQALAVAERRLNSATQKQAAGAVVGDLPRLYQHRDMLNAELAKIADEGQAVFGGPENMGGPAPLRVQYQEQLKALERHIRKVERKAKGKAAADAQYQRAALRRDDMKAKLDAIKQESLRDVFDRLAEGGEVSAKNFGSVITTRDIRKAARDADGNLLVVPKHDAWSLGYEAFNSNKVLKALYHNPISLWKSMVLAYTPRIFTNNFVGNWLIYAAREAGQEGSMSAVLDVVRHRKDAGRLKREMIDALKKGEDFNPASGRGWMYQYFGNELGNTFGYGTGLYGAMDDQARAASKRQRVRAGMYPLVSRYADMPVREATLLSYLKRQPEVKQRMAKGKSFDQAVEEAMAHDVGFGGHALKTRTSRYVEEVAGDYGYLSAGGKLASDLIPFWLWNRHILKSTGAIATERPLTAALAVRTSEMGREELEEYLGQLPEFLKTAVPTEWLGIEKQELEKLPFFPNAGDPERTPILSTHNLNPFATVGDIAASLKGGFVEADTRREALASMSQLSPLVQGFVEAVTGTDTLTGAPTGREPGVGGVFKDIVKQTYGTTPPIQAPKAIAGFAKQAKEGPAGLYTTRTKKGNPTLYVHGPGDYLANFLGAPIRLLNEKSANTIAKREDGVPARSGRKKKPYHWWEGGTTGGQGFPSFPDVG